MQNLVKVKPKPKVEKTSNLATKTSKPATKTSKPTTKTSKPATKTSKPATKTSKLETKTPSPLPKPEGKIWLKGSAVKQEGRKTPTSQLTAANIKSEDLSRVKTVSPRSFSPDSLENSTINKPKKGPSIGTVRPKPITGKHI